MIGSRACAGIDDKRNDGFVPHTPSSHSTLSTDLNPHHVRVSLRLYKAAQQSAATALQYHASEDEEERLRAAMAIGSTAEYLARAALAFHDPLLLAKGDDAESQIMLSRANAIDPLDPARLKTIDTNLVWRLLLRINQALAPLVNGGDQRSAPTALVMGVRNAAAHMALVDGPQLEAAARALVAIVAALHPVGNREERDFWPADLTATVQLLKTQNSSAAARRSQAKIDVARIYLRELLDGMPLSEQERTQAFLESRDVYFSTLERHRQVQVACPSCNRRGVITYLIEEGDPEHGGYEETPGGSYVDHGWSRSLTFNATAFQCPVCNLQLGPDEFEGAGLPTVLNDEWEEAEDPYADWEPDEDYFRGR